MKLSDLNKPISLDFSYKVEPKLLLHHPIPPILAGLNPRILLGHDWWETTRRETYESNSWMCQACGAYGGSGELEAHERYDLDFDNLISKYIGTVPLCKMCHQFIHANTLPMRCILGKLQPYTSTAKVMEHGIRILLEADLKVPKWKVRMSKVKVPTEKQARVIGAEIGDYRWKLDISILAVKPSQIYNYNTIKERLIL